VTDLRRIARQWMRDYDFLTDFPPAVMAEVARAAEPAFEKLPIRDLTGSLWSSIDNDDSKDLDQIEAISPESGGWRVYVGVAHVNWFVSKGSATDEAARHNTTSLYTGAQTFPMLPERLSTDLSSLSEGERRLAVVVEMSVATDGRVRSSSVYPAVVQNKAQLAYEAVAFWFDSRGHSPAGNRLSETGLKILERIQSDRDLQKQLIWQDEAAQALRARREESGALSFETIEFRPTVTPEGGIDLNAQQISRATQLIEDFMIAANRSTAAALEERGFPVLQRVVRTPKRWDRIVTLARSHGVSLPPQPDSKKLQEFLLLQRKKEPDHFPDLSLAVIKLLGRGEYIVRPPGGKPLGHFGLAVGNYTHSTAPNRRYPDIVTQRLLLSALEGQNQPYSSEDLEALALHCTAKEDDANKVERSVKKSVAAVALSRRIGEEFPGFVTGASEKGVWVRILNPPVEGKLRGNGALLDVGDRVRVRLVETNPELGWIDFELVART
jgi:VacB/RNase II family 3'-5' exoribonuclease